MALLIIESCEEGRHLVLRQDHHADLRPLLAQGHAELDPGHVVVAEREVEEGDVEVHPLSLSEGLRGRRCGCHDLEVLAARENRRQDPAQGRVVLDVEHAQRLTRGRRHPSIPAHAIHSHQHP